MNLFRRNLSDDLAEISQYVHDLDMITKLRDKAPRVELERYNEAIKVMQEVLIYLNERLGK